MHIPNPSSSELSQYLDSRLRQWSETCDVKGSWSEMFRGVHTGATQGPRTSYPLLSNVEEK